jgi:hypothetical protein
MPGGTVGSARIAQRDHAPVTPVLLSSPAATPAPANFPLMTSRTEDLLEPVLRRQIFGAARHQQPGEICPEERSDDHQAQQR